MFACIHVYTIWSDNNMNGPKKNDLYFLELWKVYQPLKKKRFFFLCRTGNFFTDNSSLTARNDQTNIWSKINKSICLFAHQIHINTYYCPVYLAFFSFLFSPFCLFTRKDSIGKFVFALACMSRIRDVINSLITKRCECVHDNIIGGKQI